MEKYKDLLHSMGSDSTKKIAIQSIVTAPWVFLKCQFGCARFGSSWCCPPKSPNYKQTQEIIDCYKLAILFRCSDLFRVTDLAVKVAKEMFFDGYYKAIAFGSGPCRLCKECNTQRCNFPDKAAPSMEACGIDVFQTARNNGYKITTLRTKDEEQNYFGLILVE